MNRLGRMTDREFSGFVVLVVDGRPRAFLRFLFEQVGTYNIFALPSESKANDTSPVSRNTVCSSVRIGSRSGISLWRSSILRMRRCKVVSRFQEVYVIRLASKSMSMNAPRPSSMLMITIPHRWTALSEQVLVFGRHLRVCFRQQQHGSKPSVTQPNNVTHLTTSGQRVHDTVQQQSKQNFSQIPSLPVISVSLPTPTLPQSTHRT